MAKKAQEAKDIEDDLKAMAGLLEAWLAIAIKWVGQGGLYCTFCKRTYPVGSPPGSHADDCWLKDAIPYVEKYGQESWG